MATVSWVAGTVGGWFTAGNWTQNTVPAAGDEAIISSGTPQIGAGSSILGERIVLGGADAGTPIVLQATSATFGPSGSLQERLTVTGGDPSSSPVTATFLSYGSTIFEGQIFVHAAGGGLTIDAESDGSSASFTLQNDNGDTLVLVTQESSLHFTGGQFTNNAIIQVEGSADIAAGVNFTGTGVIEVDDGGYLSVAGAVGSGQQIDLTDNTAKLIIANAPAFDGVIGLTTSAGNRIDLTNLYVQSLSYVAGQPDQPGTLILYANPDHTGEVAQLSMQLIDPEGLVRLPNGEQTLATGDFSLSGDGHGGTLVTYSPQGVTLLEASMPVPVVAATGSRVSLASILTQSFGTETPGFYGIKLIPAPVWHNVSTDDGYWSDPNVTPEWYINDVKVTKPTVITSIDGVELRVGNQIVNPAQIQFQVTPADTGTNAEFVTYDVWSVDPTVAQLVSESGAIPGSPVAADVVASANAYNSTFPAVVNDNLCNWIADNVAAGAGVPMPLPNAEQRDPTLNVEGGFWRIAYQGTGPSPVQNWGTLVQPGDIVRLAWFTISGHTTTVLGAIDSDGKIEVYDNIDIVNHIHTIGIHDASYWTGTDPASITIYRLDPNQQYLINGTSLGEVIQGSVYNNLIRPGGGADTITGGLGDNEIEGTTTQLDGITVTDFNAGDAFDFTNLADPTQVSADFDGTRLSISSHHVELASIALPSLPSTATFEVLSDGNGGSLVELVPCYCRGTLIRTARGDTPVEALAIGDKVVTAAGAARPIKWIGRRSYDGRFARGRHLLPVCIAAGALDDSVPARDLWISPHHAMFLEGVLIEARDLVNGVTIAQAARVESLEYFHIELESHDVLVAEGAPSESFIDDDSRGIFQNAHEFHARYPDLVAEPARYCAPRVAFGPALERARRRIAARAGIPYLSPPVTARPQALVIDSLVSAFGHDGGANAALDHMRALQAAGFEVSFLASQDARGDTTAISSLGVTVLPRRHGVTPAELLRQHAGRFHLVYLHRIENAKAFTPLVRQCFDAQLVYSVADLHHLRLQGEMRIARDAHEAERLGETSRALAVQEFSAALLADDVITHSAAEAGRLRAVLRELPGADADKVSVVPWSVPARPVRTPFPARSGIAFIGGYGHAPNVDAARWLVDEVFPLVRGLAPDIQCLLAGSGMSDELRRALQRPGVEVLGQVANVADVFERVRLTVAPLRFGAGLKDKVIRSMGAAVPCIGTSEAFAGMPGLPSCLQADCIRDGTDEMAAAIVRMHRDEVGNAGCAAAGLAYVRANYSELRVDGLMRALAQPALTRHRSEAERAVSPALTLHFGEARRHSDLDPPARARRVTTARIA